MWKKIYWAFRRFPAQQKVVEAMLSYGLSVKNNGIYCGNIELSISKMARALDVDRRAVMNTVDTISKNKELSSMFKHLSPTANFRDAAAVMKWGVIEIVPEDASMPGILARVANIIAEERISIRQAIVDDYMLAEEPKLYIITEKPLKPETVAKIKRAEGVKAIITY